MERIDPELVAQLVLRLANYKPDARCIRCGCDRTEVYPGQAWLSCRGCGNREPFPTDH